MNSLFPTPPEGFPKFEWTVREYSRGGFERTFTLNNSIDAGKITAKYIDGVLHVSLPFIPGMEAVTYEIPVS